MPNYQLVHKVLYWQESSHTTIALVKYVDKDNMKDIRFFIGAYPYQPDNVGSYDLEYLLTDGVEIADNGLDIFLNKSDYDEHDLLSDDAPGIAVRLV